MKTILTLLLAFVCLGASAQGVRHLVTETAKVKDKPEPIGNVLGEINKGDTVNVLGFFEGYWILNYKSKQAYVSELFFPATPDIVAAKDDWDKRHHVVKVEKPTFIKLGITTDDMVRLAGRPTDINSTYTKDYIHQQWVYQKEGEKTKYYYFENGKLTAIQD
ncbi:SH3 domain-containing protein [Mucilaginibacter pedocola]|uniref:SH3b domain-containing protein n=1 Tax=Mucilaginibacter pedocola TaxID=1792845 RepID=A0A1S9PK08_9SPHI|nr:SH3 domain-containing protein [Mucilaginibacter pedocola]OOQ60918.1 hypothetical protein BC343_23440 [Mucilaginibacter pedocola]